ncbi:MAG: hypothetical protein ACO3AC_11150, partial [Hylemonella sp.]
FFQVKAASKLLGIQPVTGLRFRDQGTAGARALALQARSNSLRCQTLRCQHTAWAFCLRQSANHSCIGPCQPDEAGQVLLKQPPRLDRPSLDRTGRVGRGNW